MKKFFFSSFASRTPLASGALLAALAIAGCASPKPQEQKDGDGGRFLRYSSSQTWVEPTAQERSAFERERDHIVQRSSLATALRASQGSLEALGYARVEADTDFNLIQGVHNELLVSKERETLRAVLKSRMGLPGRPDHQTTEAFVALRPGRAPGEVVVRARFRTTVWDSNGDSRSMLVTDAPPYQAFFAKLDNALGVVSK